MWSPGHRLSVANIISLNQIWHIVVLYFALFLFEIT